MCDCSPVKLKINDEDWLDHPERCTAGFSGYSIVPVDLLPVLDGSSCSESAVSDYESD